MLDRVRRPRAVRRAADASGDGEGRLLDALLVGAVLGMLAVTPAVLAMAWLTDDASLPTQRLVLTCLGIAVGLAAGAARYRRRQHRP